MVVSTIVGWNVLTNWLNFKSSAFSKFAEPRPLQLIRDGHVLEGNMKREMLTRDELLSKLREQGVESPEEVKWAYMESDGQVSLRKYGRDDPARVSGRKATG